MFLLDIGITKALYSLTSSSIVSAFFVLFGTYVPYVIVLIAGILLFAQKDFKKRIYIGLYIIVAEIIARGIITEGIRAIWNRPRPYMELGLEPLISGKISPSFPSGHSVFVVTLVLCIFLLNKRWGWISLGLAALIMFARVGSGIHWPSDVIGGALVALIVWVVIMFYIGPKQIFKTEKEEAKTEE